MVRGAIVSRHLNHTQPISHEPSSAISCHDEAFKDGNSVAKILAYLLPETFRHLQLLAHHLANAGYGVSTLDLPSTTANAGDVLRQGGLRADIDAIKTVLEEVASKSDSIIPVFHSYGSIPGGDAVAEMSEAVRNKIQRMVYLSAFVLPEGFALTTHSQGQVAPWARIQDHVVVVPDPVTIFYHDVADSQLAEEAAQRVLLISYSAFTETTSYTPWKTLPCTYIFCTKDRAIPFDLQKAMLAGLDEEDRANWETVTLEGGHSPFLAKPEECAKVLRRTAGELVV